MRVSKIRDISAILFRELIRDKVFLYLILVVVLLAVVSFILNELRLLFALSQEPFMMGFSAGLFHFTQNLRVINRVT